MRNNPEKFRPKGRPRNEGGVTIIETIVVIGIMTMLLVVITQIFILNYDVYFKQAGRIEADTGTMLSARTISEMARGATRVMSSGTINGTYYTSSEDELVLEIPAVNASNEIITGSYDYVAFYRDAPDTEKIYADTEAASGSRRTSGQKLVTDFNSAAVFRYNAATITDATRISVLLINETTVKNQTFRSPAWTSIFLRNK